MNKPSFQLNKIFTGVRRSYRTCHSDVSQSVWKAATGPGNLDVISRHHYAFQNRGEDMSDDHVDGITPSFDRMQREIVNMPALNCISALEVES